jgi:hypothetical protein
LKIYEVFFNFKYSKGYIGVCDTENNPHTYQAFQTNVLPRAVNLGYNAILLIGVLEGELANEPTLY